VKDLYQGIALAMPQVPTSTDGFSRGGMHRVCRLQGERL